MRGFCCPGSARWHELASARFGAFRKKVYRSIDELQADLDVWIAQYNEARPHQGRWCFGKTPMQTFLDATSGFLRCWGFQWDLKRCELCA